MTDAMTEQRADLRFRSARAVHITMPPHEPEGYTSISDSLAIGISFTGHRNAVLEDGSGRRSEVSFPAGTSSIGACTPTAWLRVSEPSEAVEVYASPQELLSASRELRVDWYSRAGLLQLGQDPVIWAVCTRFRMAALGATTIDEADADSLVHGLLLHVAVRHLDARPPRRVRGRLDQRRLVRVADLVEASLSRPPSLREMAEVAAMSPFHFQRLFRATTGLTPHAYVMARRMEAARRLLKSGGTTVGAVAARLGFSDLTHFRRSFRRHFNTAPGLCVGHRSVECQAMH
jgi:AraC family transcriptional regulator